MTDSVLTTATLVCERNEEVEKDYENYPARAERSAHVGF